MRFEETNYAPNNHRWGYVGDKSFSTKSHTGGYGMLREAILNHSKLVTSDSKKWAFSINDPSAPKRVGKKNTDQVDSIHDVIDYLDVEESARYLPNGGLTYCNIYAHDYAHLCGCYVPRVWWQASAIDDLQSGKDVEESYGKTVYEINANGIHDWFLDYGGEFKWKQATEVMELQERADAGSVCFIVARRKDTSRSGHIAAVVPRTQGHASDDWPVESQAGSVNYQYQIKYQAWWMKAKFDSFGFWHHD